MAQRYGKSGAPVPHDVRELIEHELALIAELNYEPYFLTVHDIVAFARSKGILCQGRGSAANSAVCYALGITEVDPARMSMLFERFISKERNEPPDIDVDFEHQRREEVMQYVYNKYGRDRAALAATLITYRPKSAVRDVGKALGLDLAQVDRLAGVFAWWDGRDVEPERIREAGFEPDNPVIARLVTLTGELMGFPRHLSQHVGGFVIARDLLERMVPIENAAMPDRTVIQWDKDDLDALGLLKVDCLALGMLSAIRRALAMMSRFRGRELRMQDIPAEDPEVYAMIQRADTIGVFQIESRAQMSMLPRLKPACFYDLVIEVAIVRPGPIQGGMVHPYLRRRQGQGTRHLSQRRGEKRARAHAGRADLPGAGDAARDRRRRLHAGRSRSAAPLDGGVAAQGRPRKFEQRLIDGMARAATPRTFARQIYQQILGFGEYGFPGIAFGIVRAARLRLGVAEALRAGGVLRRAAQLAADGLLRAGAARAGCAPARRRGAAVDVMVSDWDCTLEKAGSDSTFPLGPSAGGEGGQTSSLILPSLRLGLRLVAGLSEAGAKRIVDARRVQPFVSVADLAHRAQLDRRDLTALAEAGALAALAGHRHDAGWDVAGVERLPPLIADSTFDEADPALPPPTEGQDIAADYRALALTLRRHPLALLRGKLQRRRLITAAEIAQAPQGRIVRTAGIVIGRQRPDTASGVIFVTLEDETGATNVIVWRDVGDRQRRELLGAKLLAVFGKIEREGRVVHVLAGRLADLSPLLGGLETRSRDFH